jgi:hypothetical protein
VGSGIFPHRHSEVAVVVPVLFFFFSFFSLPPKFSFHPPVLRALVTVTSFGAPMLLACDVSEYFLLMVIISGRCF